MAGKEAQPNNKPNPIKEAAVNAFKSVPDWEERVRITAKGISETPKSGTQEENYFKALDIETEKYLLEQADGSKTRVTIAGSAKTNEQPIEPAKPVKAEKDKKNNGLLITGGILGAGIMIGGAILGTANCEANKNKPYAVNRPTTSSSAQGPVQPEYSITEKSPSGPTPISINEVEGANVSGFTVIQGDIIVNGIRLYDSEQNTSLTTLVIGEGDIVAPYKASGNTNYRSEEDARSALVAGGNAKRLEGYRPYLAIINGTNYDIQPFDQCAEAWQRSTPEQRNYSSAPEEKSFYPTHPTTPEHRYVNEQEGYFTSRQLGAWDECEVGPHTIIVGDVNAVDQNGNMKVSHDSDDSTGQIIDNEEAGITIRGDGNGGTIITLTEQGIRNNAASEIIEKEKQKMIAAGRQPQIFNITESSRYNSENWHWQR